MNASSEDIKDMLAAAGLGLTYETNLFVGKQPDKPTGVITVYDTGGFDPDSTGVTYEKTTVQVKSRGGDYQSAYTALKNIALYLHKRFDEINGTRYIAIWQQGDILHLGFDENNKPEFTVNFRIHRTDI